jgi:DNA-binding LacI/PurR family transcriptional regulator
MHNKFHTFSWKQFAQSNISGIIVVMPNYSTYELIAELKKRQIPFVCINLHSEKVNKDVNFVNIDFYNAAIDAVQHLVRKKRKNIAVINVRKLTDDIHQTHVISGYKQAVKSAGIKENIINICGGDPVSGIRNFLAKNLQAIKQYDAFLVLEPTSAVALSRELENLKVQVPQTISMISFFDDENTQQAGISVYSTDLKSVGYESINLLNIIFDDKDTKIHQRKIKLQLITRRST